MREWSGCLEKTAMAGTFPFVVVPRTARGGRRIAVAFALGLGAATTVVAVAVGDRSRQVTVPSATGDEHSLQELIEQGPVVVVFYRAFW